MNKRNAILLCFFLVAAAQLAAPAWMIVDREWTLREGRAFKFRTRPVDPVDAFRGRYVWLSLEPESVQVPDAEQWRYNQKGYAVLDADTNGFVMVKRLERLPPAGETAVQVRATWISTNHEVHIQWPGLESFYMNENKAPAAETAYREHNHRGSQSCHVIVRVRGTHAVIENLFVADQPIRDWLRAH